VSTAKQYRELLGRGSRSGWTEATSGDNVAVAAAGELLERLRAELAYIQDKTGIEPDQDELERLLSQARDGVRRMFDDAALTPEAQTGLEAVIRTDGSRPVLFVDDDVPDLTAPSAEAYSLRLSSNESAIRGVCRSVGRVDDPMSTAGYRGTAWVIAEGLVATNYHVLRGIAPGGFRSGNRFTGRINTGAAVHFGHEVGRREQAERRFPIRRVVSVGREGAPEHVHPLDRTMNFDGLDLAVLELEPVPGRAFPEPVKVARGDDPVTRGGLATPDRAVYLVGYPTANSQTDQHDFEKIFGGVSTFKRFAPGQIMAVDNVPEDPRGWVLTHDASTLGGNSGSAVVDLQGDCRTVLGLHFAGDRLHQNWAHTLERITKDLGSVLPPIGP